MSSNLIRRNFFMTKGQEDFLEGLEGISISEHIRRALDEYIERKRKGVAKDSPSKKGLSYNG